MNKRGDATLLMFELGFILFAGLIGGYSVNFVYSKLNDTSFLAQTYADDIANTLELMQVLPEAKIKSYYRLPKDFEFELTDNLVIISYKEAQIKADFQRNKNVILDFERKEDNLILEKK